MTDAQRPYVVTRRLADLTVVLIALAVGASIDQSWIGAAFALGMLYRGLVKSL